MREAVLRVDPGAEFWTGEGCHILELSNSPDDPEVSIARARVASGALTRWHRLTGTAERYLVLQGRGRVEVGALPPAEVGAGDVVRIPPACRQRIANIGGGESVFLAVCSPRFRPENYVDQEGRPVDSGPAS